MLMMIGLWIKNVTHEIGNYDIIPGKFVEDKTVYDTIVMGVNVKDRIFE